MDEYRQILPTKHQPADLPLMPTRRRVSTLADTPQRRYADTFPPPPTRFPAYLALANSLEAQIQANVFRPGDRLPSIRSLCEDHRLSMETVLHTFRVLEDRGLLEAKPRSGFYIKFKNQSPEPLPQPLRLEASPVEVSKLRYQAFGRMISALARSGAAEIVGYTEPAGHPKLLKQLARRASDWGCLMKPEDFIVTNGAAEALSLALRTICSPNSAVLVESPTYYGILEMIENLGLRVVELPTDPRTGVSPEDIEHAVQSIPRIGACLLVTNYSNPLGCTLSVEKKKKLVRTLAKYQVPLIEDDIFGDLCPPGDRRPVTAKAFDTEGLVLLCSSTSKTLAPGLRVGWIAPGRFRDQILQLKTNQTLACPTITQMAIAEFLEHGSYDAHLRKIRAFLVEQLQRFSNAVSCYFPPETRVSRPQGGFVLWIELAGKVDTTELAARAMNQHRIAIAPGCIFSANGKSYRKCLRLSCGYPWSARMESAIATLGQLAGETGRRRACRRVGVDVGRGGVAA
jgi:DNA-binding transcriptional MocR family regulator